MNLFLDDIRYPFQAKDSFIEGESLKKRSGIEDASWYIVRSYPQFVKKIQIHGIPDNVSFDHDLCHEHMIYYFEGRWPTEGGYPDHPVKTGFHCAQFLVDFWERSGKVKTPRCFIHTANEVGAINIHRVLLPIMKHRRLLDEKRT